MQLGKKIAGFIRSRIDADGSTDILIQLAESRLRHKFTRCARHILDAEIEDKTVSVSLHGINRLFAGFHGVPLFPAPVRTAEEQDAYVQNHASMRDLKAFARSRGLDIAYRVEPAPGSPHPARIFADVTLAPFPATAAPYAAMRERAPHWPCRRTSACPPEWTRGRNGPGAAAPI